MADGLSIFEIEKYTKEIIPKIESELASKEKTHQESLELYSLYKDILKLISPHDFASFNKYLEIDEDKRMDNRGFYHHRKDCMEEVINAFNDMEIYDKYDLLLVSLPPRTGKEQPLSSKILTPNGWSTMGEMKLGSKVIGFDGKPCNVTGVFPQGEKDVYLVVFDDDTSVECGLEHLWTVQTRDDRKNGRERTITTKDMLKNLYVENGERKNYSINYVKPVEFTEDLTDELDPYLVGALIGDGCLKDAISISNVDEEIIEKIKNVIPSEDCLANVKNTIEYSITKRDKNVRTERGFFVKSKTRNKIIEYGLNVNSEYKFIPVKYKYSSVHSRLELLRGLMDTDGYCSRENSSYCEYTTVSKQLAEDVVEVIRSLGGRATISTKTGEYKKNGVAVKCKTVYRIAFNMVQNPFYLSRKAELFVPRTTRSVKYVKSIELVGKEECQCIMVDSPKHLYVTDGFNLTHNTTFGIRFLSWICGKYPEETQLATSYSDSITTSFYIGVMEIVSSQQFLDIFPESCIVNQNAKREEIWLKCMRRYPTITFVPIGGSMTGRAECKRYLYCDDMVSGLEEALSIPRLEKLWGLYSVNCRQRKLDGCKEIHIATPWSVHDIISRLKEDNKDNPRCKIINIPCYDEDGESNFKFKGGFSTKYYNDIEKGMDVPSFNAIYKGTPIEREGLLYHAEDLSYYIDLPSEIDTTIAICDSKNLGVDNVASVVGKVCGDFVYIDDIVYNDGLPEITRPLVADMWIRNKVVRADVELNNGGNYYAEDLSELVTNGGGKTSVRIFYSGNNKKVKIITYSDFVIKQFLFKHPSTYSTNSDYARFMNDMLRWTQTGNNKHDDAPDAIAMLAQLIQDLQGNSIKILDRRKLAI